MRTKAIAAPNSKAAAVLEVFQDRDGNWFTRIEFGYGPRRSYQCTETYTSATEAVMEALSRAKILRCACAAKREPGR